MNPLLPPLCSPLRAPKPSKVAVCLYFISCMFITIGVVMLVRYGFFVKNGTAAGMDVVLHMGTGMVAVGLVLSVIMNCINRREHRLLVTYVEAKAEEMLEDTSHRQKFNKNYPEFIPQGLNGPNGFK